MTAHSPANYRVGAELARYIRNRPEQGVPPVTVLQAVIADIAGATPNLAIPLKDLVSRQAFQLLIPLAGSGSGELQRKALIDDIRQLYHPEVVQALAEVLNGFLELRSETKSQYEETIDAASLNTPKEEVQLNKGLYSFKDIGPYDPGPELSDRAKAMEELEKSLERKWQYAGTKIDRIFTKSEERAERLGLRARDIDNRAGQSVGGIIAWCAALALALALAGIWKSQSGHPKRSLEASASLSTDADCRTAEETATMKRLTLKAQELLPEATRWLEEETSLSTWSNHKWGYIYTYIDAYRTKEGIVLPEVVQEFQRIAGDAKRLEWTKACES